MPPDWDEVTTQLLKEIQGVMHAVDTLKSELRADIAELRSDMRVHKLKTGWVASISAGVTIIAAYLVSLARGGP